MTLEEMLKSDYTNLYNRAEIDAALFELPPFNELQDAGIPLKMLEKLIGKICRKYKISYSIETNYKENKNIYKALIEYTSSKNVPCFSYIYACCLYELYSKLCLKFYDSAKNNDIMEREERR